MERERAVEHAQGEPLWLALMEALRSQSWHGSEGGAQGQWGPQRDARSHGGEQRWPASWRRCGVARVGRVALSFFVVELLLVTYLTWWMR